MSPNGPVVSHPIRMNAAINSKHSAFFMLPPNVRKTIIECESPLFQFRYGGRENPKISIRFLMKGIGTRRMGIKYEKQDNEE